MWIFTTGGFVSAVEHRDDKKKVMVRARDKQSLEEMLSGITKEFQESGGKTEEEAKALVAEWPIYSVVGDYKWRAVVPKSAFAMFLVYETMNYVNYSNFKSKLTATRGTKWHDVAMKVWSAMFGIEDHKVKTGNPDVDNPKPLSSYYAGDYYGTTGAGQGKYPAGKAKGGKYAGSSAWQSAKKGNQTEGTASGSEDAELWMDDAIGAGFYDHSYDSTEGAPHYHGYGDPSGYGDQSGMFAEDLEGWEDPKDRERGYDSEVHTMPSGTGGYHTFSGKDFGIDGRGEIVDGQFIGSSFFDDTSASDTPTDAELEAVQLAIDEAWERWDEETIFNTVTGETKSLVEGTWDGSWPVKDLPAPVRLTKSVHDMTDSEFKEYEMEGATAQDKYL